MAKIKHIIPFSWRNVLLGLSGESKALAEAEYYWDGEDLAKIKIKISSMPDDEKEVRLLLLDFKASKITELEYEKTRCEILKLPWVNVLSVGFDKDTLQDGYFELDWNEWFIRKLEELNFQGNTEEELINSWLQIVCQNIALEDVDIPEEEKKPGKVVRKEVDDGKAEYS